MGVPSATVAPIPASADATATGTVAVVHETSDSATAPGSVEAAFAVPADLRAPNGELLTRFAAVVEQLRTSSTRSDPWMADDAVFTCDGGALACALLARALRIPVRLCVGLYWHTDAALRAELMGDYPDDDDYAGSRWVEHLRWVTRNALDEHHHWVILWPDSPLAVLVDPNGPTRREPHLQPVIPVLAADDASGYAGAASLGEAEWSLEREPKWRLGGHSQTYTELAVDDVWRSAVYDPDQDWGQSADACYPGLRAAITATLCSVPA